MPQPLRARRLLAFVTLAAASMFCAIGPTEDETGITEIEATRLEAALETEFFNDSLTLEARANASATPTLPPGETRVPTVVPTHTALPPTDVPPTEAPPPEPLVRHADPIADIIDCFTRASVDNSAVDVVAVNIYAADSGILNGTGATHSGRVVEVQAQDVISDTLATAWSYATTLRFGSLVAPTGGMIYELHDGVLRLGLLDAQRRVVPGTEAAALVHALTGHLLFLLPPDTISFAVDNFHTADEAKPEALLCDSAPDTGEYEVP